MRFLANLKCNHTRESFAKYAEILDANLSANDDVTVFPPFSALDLATHKFKLGAQNFYPCESGAHTGEIGKAMLDEFGVKSVLIGHSERRELGVKIYLPVDVVAAQTFSAESAVKYVPAQEIPNGWMGLDIGPASIRLFKEVIADAQTIWWNGPMGVFEMDKFSKGSIKMSHAIIDTHATTGVGGGDTADVVERAGDADEMTFISTGGGASLELIEGKELPGIKPLRKAAE